MLESIPQTAWISVIDNLGLIETCQLRTLNTSIRDRIDEDIFYIYKRIEGKKDDVLSDYLNYKIIYPVMSLTKVDISIHNFKNIGLTYQMLRYFNIFDIIYIYNLFKCPIKRAQISQLKTTKLIKAIKLVQTGLSEHYTLKCMPLSNQRIDWAVSLKSLEICDIFCYRGACEFNESQKNNLLKIKKYTYQDTFAFDAAEKLSDAQIDIMIEKKRENMLDYYALTAALEHDV